MCQSAWLSQITVDSFEFHTWSPHPLFLFSVSPESTPPLTWAFHYSYVLRDHFRFFSWQPYFIHSGSMLPTQLSSAKPPKEIWSTCCVRSFGNRYDWLGVTPRRPVKLLSPSKWVGLNPNWGKRFPRNTEERTGVSGGDSVSGPLASESVLTFHWQQVYVGCLHSQTKTVRSSHWGSWNIFQE